jgi:UDP-N-acetylmuramoyl-tripeptide--D-alanyl-D-alanine ligase
MKYINNSNDLAKLLNIKIAKDIKISNISTDTRELKPQSLFFAIKGHKFNGNDYVENALKKGACLVITDSKRFKGSNKKRIIYVNNTVVSLRKIAKNILKSFEGNVIGITGSNGKTTTTKIISSVLNKSSGTLKNYNNEIGMPLSIIHSNPKAKHLVIEMGAAKPKDIQYLSSVLKPNIGIITNIGNSHLEKLKNIDGVLKVKSELISNIRKDGYLIVPNENSKHLSFWKSLRNDINVITFGIKKSADFYPEEIKYSLNKSKFIIKSKKYNSNIQIETSLSGEHNLRNILASYAVSYVVKNSDEIFSTKLKNNLDSIIRQKQSKWIRGSVLIDDTYNANPESVKKALDLLATSSKRKIIVLGDMLELGRLRNKMHKDIGKYAATKKIDIFLGFGDLTKYAVEGFGKNGKFFKDEILLREFLKKNIQSKDIVLIKGSRGMKMERYIDV